ncbi:hypothetical protein LDENG_00272300 [Lucifuga dentata]|nr:hypothetical protein LDENG_00272300 [Lucifuga dentata]
MAMPKLTSQTKHPVRSHRKSSAPPGVDPLVEWVPLQLEHSKLVPTHNIRLLGNSSISPWTYNITFDDSLFPPYLAEARCSLQGCLDSDGLEDLSLESKPIMHQVLLLRRIKPDMEAGPEAGHHSYLYRLESRLIAVGCTCVQPSIQHQH